MLTTDMITVIIILCVLLLLFALWFFVLIRPSGKAVKNTALLCDYAHRGLHGSVPENSLAAFDLAVKEGYGIELDVQLSRDGKVMVFHDYTLNRMTGVDNKLRQLDCSDLQTLSLLNTDQAIPTFSQVLSLIDGKVPLLIELKGESLDTSLCEKVADLLKDYRGAYCIESFNPLLIGKIKKYLPDAFYGLLYTNVCRDKKKYSPLNIVVTCMALNFLARPDFIAYNQYDRNSLPVRLTTKFYRAPRFVWTVKTEKDLSLTHSLGEYPIFERGMG
ncbi:MAG: glycerophosphodiester phosphodiesterase [Clostridia bacterium]|nr:glycerophosphodiester phosphodiesterase [Clostridia bacterium]